MKEADRSEIRRAVIKWALYWFLVAVIYVTLSLIFNNFVVYSLILALAAVNFLLRIFFYLPFHRFQHKWVRIGIRLFTSAVSITLTVILCIHIIANGTSYNNRFISSFDYSGFTHSSEISYDDETGVYTVRATGDELKILQLTDVHICAGITTLATDRKALTACYEIIREARPDLIIVTGDMVYPVPLASFNSNNLVPIYQFCTFMNNIGIPWAFVYGNHDTEKSAQYGSDSFAGIFRHFKYLPDCPMLYADKQPSIYGRYNQYLRVENRDGSLNRLIFLIDSNDYVKGSDKINDYDSVHPDQIEWYEETIHSVSEKEGNTVPSFVFMHIPFKEFADAQSALERGSGDAKYILGENGEKVSYPDRDSGFFDAILSAGSTEAVFVGHDHLNNLAVNYKGIDLVYGKSIDYIAYPKIARQTAQRGGTLITVTKEGYSLQHIDYSD